MSAILIIGAVVLAWYAWPYIKPALQNAVQGVQGAVQNTQASSALNILAGSSQAVAAGAVQAGQQAEQASVAGQTQAIGGISQIANYAASAIPGVGDILSQAIGVLSKIARLIFKGADPTQIVSSMIEQVYECAAVNMEWLSIKAQMLPAHLTVSALQALLAGAEQGEQDAEAAGKVSQQACRRALANVSAMINRELNTWQGSYCLTPTTPVNLQAARQWYATNNYGPPGYYAWSVQQAAALTDAFVQALPQGVVLQ